MGYNPAIPQANDYLSITQKQTLANYSQMYIQFRNDHVMFDAAEDTNRGKHKKLTFIEQSGDQTTAATDFAWYAKNDAGAPELYGRSESDGTVFKWTKLGRISPALRLEAYVIFDLEGNIIQDKAGNDLKYNVTSVVPAQPLFNGKNVRDDWNVNFENNISTQNYFWVLSAFYGELNEIGNVEDNPFVSTVPYMFGTYGSAISQSKIRVMTKSINGLSTAAQRHTKLVHVQIYTVA